MELPAEKVKVLIVEDEALIATDLAELVEGLDFRVLGPVASSVDAITLVEKESPNIALVDLNLADGATGAHLAQRLGSAYGVAVIVVSANPEIIVPGSGGVLKIIRKPFDQATIAAALRSISAEVVACQNRSEENKKERQTPL